MTHPSQTTSATGCIHHKWKRSLKYSSKSHGLGFLRKSYIGHDKSSPYLNHIVGLKGKEKTRSNLRKLCHKDRDNPGQESLDEAIYLPIDLTRSPRRFHLRPRPEKMTSIYPPQGSYLKKRLIKAIPGDECNTPSALDHQLLQTPPPKRWTTHNEDIFALTKCYEDQTGIRHIRKYPMTLHLIDLPKGKRDDKGRPEQDNFDERINLPTNLTKQPGRFILRPRYDAHSFLRMM